MYQFQVTNYHSKKALQKAVLEGKKIHLVPVSLTKEQLRQNAVAEAQNMEPPHKLSVPLPFQRYEFQGSFNKQVPFYTAAAILDRDCNIMTLSSSI
jgi:hypothetical protein